MANIVDFINKIRTAVYGKDVRGSLADGLDAVNQETEATTGRQNDLEATFNQLIINAGNENAELVASRHDNINNITYDSVPDRLNSHSSQLSDIAINVREHGMVADGITDNLSIFNALKTQYPNSILYFPRQGNNVTYYFSTSRPNIGGIRIKTDDGVIFKVDASPDLKLMQLLNDVKIQNTVHNTTLEKSKNVTYGKILSNIGSAVSDIKNEEKYTIQDLTTWLNKVYNTSNGDIATNGTATVTSSQVTWASAFTGNPQIIKPSSLTDGACYDINLKCTQTGVECGFFLKTSSGEIIRLQIPTATTPTVKKVRITPPSTISENSTIMTLPNGGAYGYNANEEQNLSFYYKNSKKAYFMVADYTIFSYNGEYGDITDIAFMIVNSSVSNTISLNDCMKTENYIYRSHKPISIAMVGDSISYGAWNSLPPEKILPLMLQNINGIGKVEVTNYAISGRSTSNWVTDINTYDFSSFDYVLVMLGTNDQQGSASTSTYTANLTTIANKIVSDGAKPVFQIYPIFTNTTNSGVTGVTTSNYEKHAKYTQALKKWCIQNGYEFGNARRNFGANLGWYGDNIHPTEEGQVAVLKSWVEVLTRVLTK